jgi:hypothetical protein
VRTHARKGSAGAGTYRIAGLALGTALLAAVLVGCGKPAAPIASGSVGESPSSEPPPASSVGVTPPLPIPDAAFIRLPADMTRPDESAQNVEDIDWLPRLCNAVFPQPRSVENRTRMIYYNTPPVTSEATTPTGTIHHYISVSDDAAAYMAALRTRIGDGCTTELGASPGQTTMRFRVLSAPSRGDESLFIEMHWSSTIEECCPPNGEFTNYVSVTRVGTVLSVLLVAGWEGDSTDRQTAELLTDRALATVQDWIS